MKNYILDTNVLLHDPNSILSFQEHDVLIPIEVIEEIDRFKRESTERGANARTVSRTLDSLRAQGHLSEGVNLSNGGRLRIIFQNKGGNGNVTIGDNTVDGRIVALALGRLFLQESVTSAAVFGIATILAGVGIAILPAPVAVIDECSPPATVVQPSDTNGDGRSWRVITPLNRSTSVQYASGG